MSNDAYFTGKAGTRYTYAAIAARIRKEAPHTLGQHISVQLEAIGLLEEMKNGTTPFGLPYSFASVARLIEKQLTSNGLVHTPGLFRALRNDYRIKGKTRRRAIKILSDVYGLPPEEAKGLLSGAIEIEIGEAAGTITYTIGVPPDAPRPPSDGNPFPPLNPPRTEPDSRDSTDAAGPVKRRAYVATTASS
jgi:hypothetical protein